MIVSFIIVVFNEAKVLGRTFEAIAQLNLPAGVTIETIAIDGGSRDDSVGVAKSLGFSRVIELPGANIPVCRNAGLRAASGEWIAFVDADCLLDPSWLVHAARLMTSHPRLVLGWPASPPVPGTWVTRAWYAHWMNKIPVRDTEHGEPVVKQDGFRMITTRNMICHKAVAVAVGGFDESLATGEDTDFVFRATMAGTPCWGLPALASTHLGEPDTLRKFFKQQLWHANRQAYKTIMAKSGMKSGGNAPLFTAVFLASLILALAGAGGALWSPLLLLAALPFGLLLVGLGWRTSTRAGQISLLWPLVTLYGAYGLARSIDLIGLAHAKKSWKRG